MQNQISDIENDLRIIAEMEVVSSILEIICSTTGMGFAAVARVTESSWVACAVRDEIGFGLLPGGELKIDTTLCHEIRQHKQVIAFDHADHDEVYANHHTPKMYGLQSYISYPITTKNGHFFGTLCAIDPHPHQVNNSHIIKMFKIFSELIAHNMQVNHDLAVSEAKLTEERETAELRDKFIAILGHDLRNPVGAVANVGQMLLRMPVDDRVKRLGTILQNSSFRMRNMIDNILDFARGHLGEGIQLDVCVTQSLNEVLQQVIQELKLIWPDREIKYEHALDKPVRCDAMRVAQLLSNLLSNAITHGDKIKSISVVCETRENDVFLSVTNSGAEIPQEVLTRLFQPFFRVDMSDSAAKGLGLGLYISSEIAKAHGGVLHVDSSNGKVCFSCRFPC